MEQQQHPRGAAAPTSRPRLFVDLMSQPSRACCILVRMFNLPVDLQMVRLDKQEHKTAAFRALNPLSKVPFLTDGSFTLPESVAIIGYLAERFSLPAPWSAVADDDTGGSSSSSSSSSRAQARATQAAASSWQHLTIRRGCTTLAFFTIIGPRVFGVPASPPVAAHGLQILKQALADLERCFLLRAPAAAGGQQQQPGSAGRRRFMTGDRLAPADVLCCCELEQLRMMVAAPDQPQLAELLAPHPAVRAWMADVRQAVGPAIYDDAHSKLAAAVARLTASAVGGSSGGGGRPKL